MKYLKLLMTVVLMCSCIGCANAESSEIEGKLWFNDINFPEVEYKTATLGISYYEKGSKTQLYDDRVSPVLSKDGKLLFCEVWDFENKSSYFELRDLETDKQLYRLDDKTLISNQSLNRVDHKSIYLIKNSNEVFNILLYDFISKNYKAITRYSDRDYRIYDVKASADGKHLVYSRYFQPEINALSKLHILDLETNNTIELPYATAGAEWSNDSSMLMFNAVEVNDNKVVSDHAMYTYKTADKTVTKMNFGKEAEPFSAYSITFSPDDQKVAFIRIANSGAKSIWTMNVDGTNQKQLPIDGVFSFLEWTE